MILEILTDGRLIEFFGWLVSGLLAAVLGLGLYIWRDRKQMIRDERAENKQMHTRMEKKQDVIQNQVNEMTPVIATLSTNVHNLTGWLKNVSSEQKQFREDLQELEKDVSQIKGSSK